MLSANLYYTQILFFKYNCFRFYVLNCKISKCFLSNYNYRIAIVIGFVLVSRIAIIIRLINVIIRIFIMVRVVRLLYLIRLSVITVYITVYRSLYELIRARISCYSYPFTYCIPMLTIYILYHVLWK